MVENRGQITDLDEVRKQKGLPATPLQRSRWISPVMGGIDALNYALERADKVAREANPPHLDPVIKNLIDSIG